MAPRFQVKVRMRLFYVCTSDAASIRGECREPQLAVCRTCSNLDLLGLAAGGGGGRQAGADIEEWHRDWLKQVVVVLGLHCGITSPQTCWSFRNEEKKQRANELYRPALSCIASHTVRKDTIPPCSTQSASVTLFLKLIHSESDESGLTRSCCRLEVVCQGHPVWLPD